MRQTLEFSIELSAQELLAPPTLEGFAEIDDLRCLQPAQVTALAANTVPPAGLSDDDLVEIELTAAEMDALLNATR